MITDKIAHIARAVSDADALKGHLVAIATILTSIECPACREGAAGNVRKLVPLLIVEALNEAAKNDAVSSGHIH